MSEKRETLQKNTPKIRKHEESEFQGTTQVTSREALPLTPNPIHPVRKAASKQC